VYLTLPRMLAPLPWLFVALWSPASTLSVPVTVSSHEVRRGDTITAAVTVDMTASSKALGSIEARLRFDPAVVSFVAASQGTFGGLLQLNADSASRGVIRFAAINADDSKNTGSVIVLQIELDVVGDSGTSTPLSVELGDLTATDFTSLLPEAVISDGRVSVEAGGDRPPPARPGQVTLALPPGSTPAGPCPLHSSGLPKRPARSPDP